MTVKEEGEKTKSIRKENKNRVNENVNRDEKEWIWNERERKLEDRAGNE